MSAPFTPKVGGSILSLCAAGLFFAAVILSAPLAEAARFTWTGAGSNNNWSNENNFNQSPAADPAVGDDIWFMGPARLTNIANNSSGMASSFNDLFFRHDSAGSFLIGGGVITNSGDIFVQSTNFKQTFTNTSWVVTGAAAQWRADSNSLFTTGNIQITAPQMKARATAGNTNSIAGNITGSAVILANGQGLLMLSGNNSGMSGIVSNQAGITEIHKQGGLGTGSIIMDGGSLNIRSVNQTNANAYTISEAMTWDVASGITNTITGAISGTAPINKSGAGALIFQGNNSFTTATITNSAGSLIFDHANAINGVSTLEASGGTLLFNRGITNTSATIRMTGGTLQETSGNISVGALTMVANSSLDLETGAHNNTLRFSTATNLTGSAVLTIYGWTGTGSGGTGDLIFFTNSSEVTSSFLSNVTFFGGVQGAAQLLGTGELVPITPEPGTTLGGFSMLLIFARRLVRRRSTCPNGFPLSRMRVNLR
jgi:hypothetical protein